MFSSSINSLIDDPLHLPVGVRYSFMHYRTFYVFQNVNTFFSLHQYSEEPHFYLLHFDVY